MEDPVVPLERSLYSHLLAGLLRKRQFEYVLLKTHLGKIPHWERLFVNREKRLHLSVNVNDFKLAGKKQTLTRDLHLHGQVFVAPAGPYATVAAAFCRPIAHQHSLLQNVSNLWLLLLSRRACGLGRDFPAPVALSRRFGNVSPRGILLYFDTIVIWRSSGGPTLFASLNTEIVVKAFLFQFFKTGYAHLLTEQEDPYYPCMWTISNWQARNRSSIQLGKFS